MKEMKQLALVSLPFVSVLSLSRAFFQLFNFWGHETKGEDKAIGGTDSFYWRITKPSTIQCQITGDHTRAAERIPVRLGFSWFIKWEFPQTLRGMDHVVPQGMWSRFLGSLERRKTQIRCHGRLSGEKIPFKSHGWRWINFFCNINFVTAAGKMAPSMTSVSDLKWHRA